jgi:hypothetical protein
VEYSLRLRLRSSSIHSPNGALCRLQSPLPIATGPSTSTSVRLFPITRHDTWTRKRVKLDSVANATGDSDADGLDSTQGLRVISIDADGDLLPRSAQNLMVWKPSTLRFGRLLCRASPE